MISINPTIPTQNVYKTFRSNPNRKNAYNESQVPKTNEHKALKTSLVALAFIGVAAFIAGKKSVNTVEEALKKNGLEIVDGITKVKATGEKYTGMLKHNLKPFGFKKQKIQFDNGKITEKVCYNRKGEELEGEFYRDGKLRVKVSKDCDELKRYVMHVFEPDGNLKVRIDCNNQHKNKFSYAREVLETL